LSLPLHARVSTWTLPLNARVAELGRELGREQEGRGGAPQCSIKRDAQSNMRRAINRVAPRQAWRTCSSLPFERRGPNNNQPRRRARGGSWPRRRGGGEGRRQPVREEGTKRQSATTPGEGEISQGAREGGRQPFREEEMKRQSATTEGEGGVCRGAGEGWRQPVQEEGIK
jgi:hypothetical protein